MIDNRLKDMRLIPLQPYSKRASAPWKEDGELTIPSEATGYAVDCGKSGLVVIDCDVKNGVNGTSAFLEWLQDKGEGAPTTMLVQTPSGGLHVYYRTPPGVTLPTSAGTFLKGVDVRASGGYVVGPGSVIKTEAGSEETYIAYDEAEIEEAPDSLVQALLALQPKQRTTSSRKTPAKSKDSAEPKNKESSNTLKGEEEYEQKMMKEYALLHMTKAEEGSRNDHLNRLSYFMGRKRVPELDAKQIIDIAIKIGLDPNEAVMTFESGYTAGLGEEVMEFDAITKIFNSDPSRNLLDDPYDVEYYSHSGLAGNFYRKFGEIYIYWTMDMSWYKYEVEYGYWRKVVEEEVKAVLKKFLEELVEYNRLHCPKLSSAVYKAQEKVFTRGVVDNVVAMARLVFMNNNPALFDSDSRLVNCKNGVVDLKNGEILDHNKDFYISRYIPVNYFPEAKDVYCDKILSSIHPDQLDYVRILSGQSLVGEQPISQSVFFLHGGGSNGKSTFIDLLLKTSGSYGKLQPPTVLADEKGGGDKYALADFNRVRCAVIEELIDSKHLNSGALKRIVGTNRINARQIYGSYHEFENQATVFVSCNRLPIVTETDEGTWRRLTVISFPYSYRPASECSNSMDIPNDPMVLLSANRNPKTAEAFLAWRISGAIDWCKNSNVERKVPSSVKKKSDEWREDNDLIRAWFNSNIEIDGNCYITVSDLYKSYLEWAAERGQSKVSQRTFLDSFLNHSAFLRNSNTFYKYNSKPKQSFSRSRFETFDPTHVSVDEKKPSHIEGLRFKIK